MTRLRSTVSVPLSEATGGVTMTLRVRGVRRFQIRTTLALLIIKIATLVSPIVTRIEIDDVRDDDRPAMRDDEAQLRSVLG